jgi:hypothetical protein
MTAIEAMVAVSPSTRQTGQLSLGAVGLNIRNGSVVAVDAVRMGLILWSVHSTIMMSQYGYRTDPLRTDLTIR